MDVGTGVVVDKFNFDDNGKTDGAIESIAGIDDNGVSDDANAIFGIFDGRSSN